MKKLLRFLFAFVGIKCAQSSGVISVLIRKITNSAGENFSNECCDGKRSKPFGICDQDECDSYFNVCFSAYSSKASDEDCLFGEKRTPVLGGNSFENPDPEKEGTYFELRIPFSKAWMMHYKMTLRVLDEDIDAEDSLIEEVTQKGFLRPSEEWEEKTHNGRNAVIQYSIKIQCDPNYYGYHCSTHCEARDDRHGHYICDSRGKRICNEGWKGDFCKTPICSSKCNLDHGYCDEANECRCRHGWQGEFCEDCIPAEGCQHGTCNSEFECNCETNWGGRHCEINLNACGSEPSPCLNESKCENLFGNFTCTCLPGYFGDRCQHVENACVASPCQNGAKCNAIGETGYQCVCQTGWTGQHCDIDINECSNDPCQNGGVCIDQVGDFECNCQAGWRGKTCQLDVDECEQMKPCVNSKGCINRSGSYICICQEGWSGQNCDINVNECHTDDGEGPCQNGGTCIDGIDSFTCHCANGFEGQFCEHEVNECLTNPCRNNGECLDLIGDYKCLCPSGYSGRECEVPMGFCAKSECLNNGTCFNVENDYECKCPAEYEGRHCERMKDQCRDRNADCEVLDACRVQITDKRSFKSVLVLSGICGRHGTCVARGMDQFYCQCQTGFAGKFCQNNLNDCSSSPCENGGTCVDGNNAFKCICPPGYSGANCQISKSPCGDNPCLNGAECISGEYDDYECACPSGFAGRNCQIQKGRSTLQSICKQSPCSAGRCVPDAEQSTGYRCECPATRYGSICQFESTLACDRNDVCSNHGTCINLHYGDAKNGPGFQCHCNDGYFGQNCEKTVNNCNPDPCFNNGTCIDKINHYECQCAPGFVGADCRKNVDDCESKPCSVGSKCLDQIDGYHCTCPDGRFGALCDRLITSRDKRSCAYKGNLYVHSYSWSERCNKCKCIDGDVQCTQLDCGPKSCSAFNPSCNADEECATEEISLRDNCVSTSCSPRYFCRKKMARPLIQPICDPKSALSTRICAKIIIQFHVEKISQLTEGVHATDVCAALRYLPELVKYADGRIARVHCYSDVIGNVHVAIEHETAEEVATAIRIAVIDGKHQSHFKDRAILDAVYDIDILPAKDEMSGIWILLAIMLSVLIISILILGAFIIRQRRGKKDRTADSNDSNYTLGSGVTDQLVMTQSPNSQESDIDGPQFVYINPKELDYRNQLQKHINIISNRRVSQILHNSTINEHRGPPPTYEESHRLYATIETAHSDLNQPRRITLGGPS